MIPLLLAVLLSSSLTGRYEAPGATLELHVGHDGTLRGALIEGPRIAALAPITIDGSKVTAAAHYDDDSRATLSGTASKGIIRIGGKRFVRKAVERPAPARVRREIFAAYEQLAEAVNTKDHAKFQALRVDDFATIPPDSSPRNAEFMAQRAAGLLATIQPPIRTRNDILTLTVRGDEAIATVRQHFSRQQPSREGVLRLVETEVTQRETWRRTKDGWKLTFVDEVRDHVRR
ncbi:MAG TPA: nuclear transport factor 2 family protein [Thermoanaerobaculia bacterium]|nr:nuclear transport factor 2 family protein [Thermoanaerobaculia bacterium]